MIATAEPNESKLVRLRIVLKGSDPEIWRRVLIPAVFTLGDLHAVIQSVMPWYDYHVHEFLVGTQHYGMPNPEFDMGADPILEEDEILLAEVFANGRRRIEYTYDFGDGWEHVITLDGYEDAEDDVVYPLCVDGANACPPEDSGSIFGYYEKLSVMNDASHPMHADTLDWMPSDFDPTRFDPEEANELLRFDAGEEEEDVDDIGRIPPW